MMKKQSGFTFIELILTMVLCSILAGIVVEIIAGPIQSYFWYTQRSLFVDMAEVSLESIQSDLKNSLPQSVVINSQPEKQELQFRKIFYKGVTLPTKNGATQLLTLNSPLPESIILEVRNGPLFIVFPAAKDHKDKLYPFSLVNTGDVSEIKLNEALPSFLQKPMPFFIVSSLTKYECLQEAHTLVRITQFSAQNSEKFLIANQVSDCQFTLQNLQPPSVLVSLSFGEDKSHIKLTQPIFLGKVL